MAMALWLWRPLAMAGHNHKKLYLLTFAFNVVGRIVQPEASMWRGSIQKNYNDQEHCVNSW